MLYIHSDRPVIDIDSYVTDGGMKVSRSTHGQMTFPLLVICSGKYHIIIIIKL
jgi:hypothetical protein